MDVEQALANSHALLFALVWLTDPTAWIGLLTLTAIQIVLGIDNLLFIAILSARLPSVIFMVCFILFLKASAKA